MMNANGHAHPDPGAETSMVITNAVAVLPGAVLEQATVVVENGLIAAIAEGPPNVAAARVIDADGAYLLPGVVDLHNDNLEFEIHPRINANLPLPFALSSMERRLAGSGVTTEFHAVYFQDVAKKGRSISDAERKAAYLAELDDDPRQGVRHHILHRLDVRTPESLAAALPSLRRVKVPFASLNDHTPGQGQYRDLERFIRMANESQLARNEAPTDPAWYRERMRNGLADREAVPSYYRQVTAAQAEVPLVLATHDDDTVEKVDEQLVLGATISEFPITIEAAQHARNHGMTIVVGAPNIVRGGSQSGNLSALDLFAAGLADVICADYHAPSLVPAAFTLWRQGLCDLPAAIATISGNAARAVGLHDRGEIAVGLQADLAIVRLDEAGWPHVEATIVGGHSAFHFARHPERVAHAGAANGHALQEQARER